MNSFGIITLKMPTFRLIPQFIINIMPKKILVWLICCFKTITFEYVDIPNVNIKSCIVYLPFTNECLRFINEKQLIHIYDYLLNRLKNEKITYLIFEKQLKKSKIFKKLSQYNKFIKINSNDILTALSVDILKYICKTTLNDIAYLDIGIVEHEFTEKSLAIIKMLSPYVKYITLKTDNVRLVHRYLEDIYDDTGLIIRTTSNESTSFKCCNVIFILDDFLEFINNASINKNALIFNLDKDNIINPEIKNVIIDNIKIDIPNCINNTILKIVNVKSKELIEIIISMKLQLILKQLNIKNYISINKEFYNIGCKIKVLKGFGRNIEISKLKPI